MSGVIPQSAPPGFMSQFGNMMAQHGANHSASTAALLDARSSALGDILGNIHRIAEVGGGNFAPDNLLQGFAGAQGPMIGGEYAAMADRLRLAQAEADVNATNRRGSGGGGGGGMGSPGTWIVENPTTGAITEFDPADMDAAMIDRLLSGNSGLRVLQYGRALDGDAASRFAPPQPAPSDRRTFDDGSYIENGTAYNAQGEPL